MRHQEIRIVDSARKHGFSDLDILHAVRNFVRRFPHQGLHDVTILVGPARNGVTLLEIGIIEDPDDLRIIHADTARAKYLV